MGERVISHWTLSDMSSSWTLLLSHVLVLPAASSPSINRRISFDPKILFISFEMFCPMAGDQIYGSPVVAEGGEIATLGVARGS